MLRYLKTDLNCRIFPSGDSSLPVPLSIVSRKVKEQLRQQFAALDPVVLLKTIRETQQELNALSDGDAQPPIRTTEDLGAFLDGLATAWQHDIGIGRSLAAPPSPHHRAYGSVHGGSAD